MESQLSGDVEPAVTFESHFVISAHHLLSQCISLLFLQSKSEGFNINVTEEKTAQGHRDVKDGFS